MLYLNEDHIRRIGIDWKKAVGCIEDAVRTMEKNDFAQPVKPYLRYRDPKNRIIAMPAFLGGDCNTAGIKWIASFPGNIHEGLPRAHSVVVLNNADTGAPMAIINTALLSIIRTAAVSGLMMKYFDLARPLNKFNLGIIGWGPIGVHHMKMCASLYGDAISAAYLYDIRPVIDPGAVDFFPGNKIRVASDWRELYRNSDVVITCTVSGERYIDEKPKKGALLLNVSLRDYKMEIYEFVKRTIIVDDWDEVCRENTDIENLHRLKGLGKDDVRSIIDAVIRRCIEGFPPDDAVMFNPMGMAVFDIALGNHYYRQALTMKAGVDLD